MLLPAVVVSEAHAHRVSIFSRELERIMSVGSLGKGADQFNAPIGVAIANNDRTLVADCGNHRVQVLTIDGQFLGSVGTEGKGPW